MNAPRRKIRLTYVNTKETVLAEMLDDEAPGVCELVWALLPVETKVIHGMYSGAEVFAMLENPKPAPQENLVQLPLPGELLYFFDQNVGAAGGRKPVVRPESSKTIMPPGARQRAQRSQSCFTIS